MNHNQICRVSRSWLFLLVTFRLRTKTVFGLRNFLHLSQISLFGQPVSDPQLRHGNIFSLTPTDYHLLWLTEENLVQTECSVYFVHRNHYLNVHNVFKIT